MAVPSSQIFCPYRAIGFCCNHVPLVCQSQGPDSLVVTAVGKTFHVYKCDKLKLIFVGAQQPEPLQCLAIQGKIVFASYGSVIKAFKRGKEVNVYTGHEGCVISLLPFGEHLVSIDDHNCLKIWRVKESELYGEIHFDLHSFLISSVVHPSTYLNKVLLGSRQGQLQLWNVRTNKLIYSFAGWGSPVLSLSQSPAVDVVGVGLESGKVILHNLKFDETLMNFHQEWGPVTALSFRTDGTNTVASSSPLGHIAVWDLDRRRLAAVLRDAHNGTVSGMEFLSSQPLLVTSGPDNSIKMWIFDQSDGSARLLRSRCGHSAPPTRLRFCSTGEAVKILSTGLDNALRVFAIHKDVQMNMELSQGSLVKKSHAKGVKVETLKLPAVVDFALESTRAHEWDSVVTCHSGLQSAHSWNLQKYVIGQHSLTSKHSDSGARPLCVTLTGCGNFAILGMTSGHVEMFNVQSGIHRGQFGRPKAHSKPVRGVAVDALNMEVFSGSSDSTIKFWSFHDKTLLDTLQLSSPVSSLTYHRESSMLAVSCDNFIIHVVDTDTRRIVRTFRGHVNQVTDMSFSPDGRWLVSSAMDCSIRTWDLPTGRMIDIFLVDSPATSLALSPTGDFLASSHVDDLGIYLWSNKTLYSHVSLRPLPSNHTPSLTELPTTALVEAEHEQEGEEGFVIDTKGSESRHLSELLAADDSLRENSTPLSEGLVTLSSLPKSRWSNLQNLDIIKLRNKPVEPPKQPKQAPFFLPTLPGLQPKFIPATEDEGIPLTESGGSRILDLGKLQPLTEFQKCLEECASTKEFEPLLDILKQLSPAAVDSEFRSMSPDAGGSVEWLECFLEFLLEQLKTNKNYELIQSYLGLFLKLHSSLIPEEPRLVSLAQELLLEHQKTWQQLQSELNMCACLLGYCKSATIT